MSSHNCLVKYNYIYCGIVSYAVVSCAIVACNALQFFCANNCGLSNAIFTRRKRCIALNIFRHVEKPAIIARKSQRVACNKSLAHETAALERRFAATNGVTTADL